MKAAAIGIAVVALYTATAAADSPRAARTQTAQALLAAAQHLARVTDGAVLMQSGSLDDVIHVRAMLAGLRPALQARLAALSATRTTPYRLPVAGRIVTGFGTVSEAGVRSRGLGFAVRPGALVVAPAAGVVRYAQAFRGYGGTVIVDHGAGWTSVLTGLGTLAVRPGARVRGGAAIGTARRGGDPQVTLELRRRGEPVDATRLIR